MDYSNIIGHNNIINSLKNAVKKDNIAHSYLFEGPKSIGKMKLAKVFAKALLCHSDGEGPCNICSSCKKFESGNHPDLFIEDSQGSSFKKEDVEKIQENIKTLPYEGKKKVFILSEIDKMTPQAQNSFLKTLEEPPAYVVILMTVTNSYSLLPTIVSRCQILKLTPIKNEVIEESLINQYNIPREEAKIITSFSSGIIGKAINMGKSEEFRLLRESTIDVIDTTISGDKFKVFSTSDYFDENKDNVEDILDMMMVWFRDILILKELNDDKLVINSDKLDILNRQCKIIPRNKIHDIIDVIGQTKENIISNVSYKLSIEIMLLRIQEV